MGTVIGVAPRTGISGWPEENLGGRIVGLMLTVGVGWGVLIGCERCGWREAIDRHS